MTKTTSIKTISKTRVRPLIDDPDQRPYVLGERVELMGWDATFKFICIHGAYMYAEPLPIDQLQVSFAKALASFPLLAGEAVKRGRKYFIDLNDAGAMAIHQRVHIKGPPLRYGDTSPLLDKLCRGPTAVTPDIPLSRLPLLTITVSDITYDHDHDDHHQDQGVGVGVGGCWPWAKRKGSASASASVSVEANGGGANMRVGAEDSHWPAIRCVVGFRVPHSVLDGCGLSRFSDAVFAAHQGLEYPSPCYTRPFDLLHKASEVVQVPRHFQTMSTARFIKSIVHFNIRRARCIEVSLRFTKAEVEAIKAAATDSLKGTDKWVSTSNAFAAHVWPIVSEAMASKTGSRSEDGADRDQQLLAPMAVVLNTRRLLSIPDHYCGNAFSIQEVAPAFKTDTLGQRAVKVRAAGNPSQAALQEEVAFIQHMCATGKDLNFLPTSFSDSMTGKRDWLVWDDMTSFMSDENHMALAGVRPLAFEPGLPRFLTYPGVLVVTCAKDGLGGREVRGPLLREHARKLLSPEFMDRLHAYRQDDVTSTYAWRVAEKALAQ